MFGLLCLCLNLAWANLEDKDSDAWMFDPVIVEFLRKPSLQTFSKMTEKDQNFVLASMLGEVAFIDGDEISKPSPEIIHQILRKYFYDRPREEQIKIYRNAVAEIIVDTNYNRESLDSRAERALRLLNIANTIGLEGHQKNFCHIVHRVIDAKWGGFKLKGNHLSYSRSHGAIGESAEVLLGSLVAQMGPALESDCEVEVEVGEKKQKGSFNLRQALALVNPDFAKYIGDQRTNSSWFKGQISSVNAKEASNSHHQCSELEFRCLVRDSLEKLAQSNSSKKHFFQVQQGQCSLQGRLEKSKSGEYLFSSEFSSTMDDKRSLIRFRTLDEWVQLTASRKIFRTADEEEKKLLASKSRDCRRVFNPLIATPNQKAPSTQSLPANEPQEVGHALFIPFSTR